MPFMLEPDAYSLLESCGLPLPRYRFISSIEEAREAGEEIGYPVALKIVSEDIVHKSDAGCVKLFIKNTTELERAYRDIISAAYKAVPDGNHLGVIVSEMISGGTEIIIGLGSDAEFGKFIMFGLGGVTVELYKDVSFRLLPIDRETAAGLIEDVKGSALLKGYRGSKPKDLNSLIDIIVKCSKLAEAYENISEMDLNPITVTENGAYILDARILNSL